MRYKPDSSERVLILGQAGMGKTTYLTRVVSGCSRVLLVNTLSLGVRLPQITSPSGAARRMIQSVFRFSYDTGDSPQWRENLGYVLQTAMRESGRSPITVCVDEVDAIQGRDEQVPQIASLFRYGRNYAVSVYATARRPKEVSLMIRANLTAVVAFRMTEPDDLDWLAGLFGKAAASRVRMLPRFRYLFFDAGRGVVKYEGMT